MNITFLLIPNTYIINLNAKDKCNINIPHTKYHFRKMKIKCIKIKKRLLVEVKRCLRQGKDKGRKIYIHLHDSKTYSSVY